MHTSRVFGLDLPDALDVHVYDDVLESAVILANPNDYSAPWKTNVWFGFTASWLGWGMRIRAATDYDVEFASQLAHGTSPARGASVQPGALVLRMYQLSALSA